MTKYKSEGAIQIETPELIQKLEDLVDGSKQLMHTAFVNIDQFFALTNKLRASLPEDVKAAARITRDADHIVSDAREQAAQVIDQAKADAARIIEEGRAEAARLVEASEISRLATAQAKEIIASAEQEARSTRVGADEYAREVLSDLEGFVEKVLTTIQRGRDKLEHKSDAEQE